MTLEAETHLDEAALEAAATEREDLLSATQLAHLDECARCAAWVEHARTDAADASLALRRAMPEIDGLERMIVTAMQSAPDPAWMSSAPSRRSLWLGGTVGALLATVLAIWSSPGASLTGVPALGRQGWTLLRASNNVVDSTVPLGWAGVAAVGLFLSMVLFVPMRVLLGQRRLRIPGLSTLSGMIAVVVISVVTLSSGVARAYRLDGAWPQPEPRVTVDVQNQLTSVALRQAADSAHLGIMLSLAADPRITLHVEDAPIGEVMEALLGDADVVVRPSEHLIRVTTEPSPIANAAEPSVLAPPPVPPLPVPPAPVMPVPPPRARVVALGPGVTPIVPPLRRIPHAIASPPAGISDRVTLGGDLVVGENEQVRDVVSAGGSVDVRGRAFGNVVTAGGDAAIRGEVIGDVTSAGGDIEVFDGAIVHGDLNAMGGEITVHDDAEVYGRQVAHNDRSRESAAAADVSDDSPSAVRWALLNVLVFLLGLLMLGSAEKRLSTLRAELAARPIRSALGGLFGLPAGILLSIVLLLTIIGAPGAAILATMLFCAFWVGWTTIAYWIGTALPIKKLEGRPVMQLAAGVAALFVVGLVPKIGTFLVFVGIMAGLGAVISTSFGKKDRTLARPSHVPTGPFRSSLRP